MKKHSKKKQNLNHSKLQELAEDFGSVFDKKVQITVLPNGVISYKNFLIKPSKRGTYGIYYGHSVDPVEVYHLKSCALMAAKAYNTVQINRFFEIKELDTRYSTSHTELLLFKQNIKLAKDFDRYVILLNKLEEADLKAKYYKDKITVMFRNAFA